MARGIRRSVLQTEILGYLQKQIAPSVTALSEAIDKPRPSVSRSLHALADQGLVERQGKSWHVTDAGKTVAERAIAQLTETTEQMIELAGNRFNAAKRLGHGDTLASILGQSFNLPDSELTGIAGSAAIGELGEQLIGQSLPPAFNETMSRMLNGTLGVTSAKMPIGIGLAEANPLGISDSIPEVGLGAMADNIGLAVMPAVVEPSIAALDMSRLALPEYPNISRIIGLSVLDAIPPELNPNSLAFGADVVANSVVDSTLIPIAMGLSAFSDAMNRLVSSGPDTEALSHAITGMWSSDDALQGFLQQSAGAWSSVERVLDRIRERVKKDDALRSIGIDTDRLRVAGIYDWLSHVSDVIDRAESEEGGTPALIGLAKSEVVTDEMFTLLNELPENVREVRVEAIRQALDAHRQGHYIAAISTFVAQLDGLIGDFLVLWQRYKNMPENRLKNMRARIENLNGFMDPNGDYPSVITPEPRFTNPRNQIAHGDPEADYSELNSARHIFFVLSLLSVHLSPGQDGKEAT